MSKEEMVLFLPEAVLTHIGDEAARIDRSLSWCVQFAWLRARAQFADLEPAQPHPAAEKILMQRFDDAETKRQQTLFMPQEMAEEMRQEAARHDSSVSRLVVQAWCLALDQVAAQEPPE